MSPRPLALLFALAVTSAPLGAQASPDTTRRPAQDGVFNRPVVGQLDRTAIGGYVEANSNYGVTDGIGEGFSMELRRFNIFLFSAIGSRVRFLAELEFEHGTKEIKLETALIDVRFTPSFVVRGGIILPPLGAFNLNHDSPRWNFIDRPIVSTEIIPATLSEVGFGVRPALGTLIGNPARVEQRPMALFRFSDQGDGFGIDNRGLGVFFLAAQDVCN